MPWNGGWVCRGTGPQAPSPGRDALEGKGPHRRPQRWLGRRLEGVAEAVGGGYCRLQTPLMLALGVMGTVAGLRLGALEAGGGVPPFQCIPAPFRPTPCKATMSSPDGERVNPLRSTFVWLQCNGELAYAKNIRPKTHPPPSTPPPYRRPLHAAGAG